MVNLASPARAGEKSVEGILMLLHTPVKSGFAVVRFLGGSGALKGCELRSSCQSTVQSSSIVREKCANPAKCLLLCSLHWLSPPQAATGHQKPVTASMHKVTLFRMRIATALREALEAEAFTISMVGPVGARSAIQLSEAVPHREKKKGFPEEDLDTARAAVEKVEGNSCAAM